MQGDRKRRQPDAQLILPANGQRKGFAGATDTYPAYKRVGLAFPHQTVNHLKGEYVRGNVHTANLDSFWSLLKRGIMGTYHNVSKAICRCIWLGLVQT